MSVLHSIRNSSQRINAKPNIPLRRLLPALFLRPAILFEVQQDKWSRAFRIMALISFACGVITGTLKLPRIKEAVSGWAGWFQAETGSLELQDGRLSWERPTELPHTARHDRWRVDFMPPEQDFPPDFRLGPENQGLWLAEDKALFWWQQQGREQLAFFPVLKDGKLWGMIETHKLWPDGLKVSGNEFRDLARNLLRQVTPVFLLHHGLLAFFHVFFYTLMFTLVPIIFRSPLAANGFKRLFTFYLYAGIPAVIVASVYASLGLPWLDMPLAFVVVLTVYLIFVYQAAVPEANKTPPKPR